MESPNVFERYGFNNRNLPEINRLHRKDFAKLVLRLSKKFPNQAIRVLDEGAGKSTFAKDLSEKLRGKVKTKVVRTDIDKSVAPDAFASPEELRKKFGPNSFHLIVSTFGGTTYAPISQKKAVANIIEVLKPGGIASILTVTNSSNIVAGKNIRGKQIEGVLKRYKNLVVKETKVSPSATRITIKKLK